MFSGEGRVQRSLSHHRTLHLILVLLMLMASSFVAGTPAAAQDEDPSNSCAPELLESRAEDHQCGSGPEGEAVMRWATRLTPSPDAEYYMTNIVLRRDRLFVADSLERLYAVDTTNGQVLWDVAVEGLETSWWLAAGDDTLYAKVQIEQSSESSIDTHEVVALSLDNGERLWTSALDYGKADLSSPIAHGDLVYVRTTADSNPGAVFALNASDGTLAWQFEVLGQIQDLAVTDDAIYVGSVTSQSAWLQKIDASNGQEVWRSEDGVAHNQILVFDHQVYVVGDVGLVYGFDTSTGAPAGLVLDDPECWHLVPGETVTCGDTGDIPTPDRTWHVDQDMERETFTISLQTDHGPTTFYESNDRLRAWPQLDDGFMYLTTSSDYILCIGGDSGPHAIEQTVRSLPAGEGIEIGQAVLVTGGDTVLRGAPTDTSVEIMSLPEGTTLEVVGGPLEENGDTWWQVTEPASGYTGYVPASSLAAVLE